MRRIKRGNCTIKLLHILRIGKFSLEFEEDTQLGKLIIFIRKEMTHKGENYSVKMQKYYFCNGTLIRSLLQRAFLLQVNQRTEPSFALNIDIIPRKIYMYTEE